jgi:hypothetical protein
MAYASTHSLDLSTITIRRPRPHECFRVRPETAAFVARGLYHEGRFYLVQGEILIDQINLHAPRRTFGLGCNHVGEMFLWPLSIWPSDDPNPWLQARETAKMRWTRLQYGWTEDEDASVKILTTSASFRLPQWPTASLLEIVLEACAGRYICRPEHPVIQKIRHRIQHIFPCSPTA